jgi:antitoxin CcdA
MPSDAWASITLVNMRQDAVKELTGGTDDGIKQSTNLTLTAKLVHKARLLRLNPGGGAEEGIRCAVAKARDQQWVERNRGAMASYDAFVERGGLLLEDLRTF